jgi:hypothetical protein
MRTRTLILAIVAIVAAAYLLDTIDLHVVAAGMLYILGVVVGFYAGARKGDRSHEDMSPQQD